MRITRRIHLEYRLTIAQTRLHRSAQHLIGNPISYSALEDLQAKTIEVDDALEALREHDKQSETCPHNGLFATDPPLNVSIFSAEYQVWLDSTHYCRDCGANVPNRDL